MLGVQILQWGECGDTFAALACVETCEYERQIIEDKKIDALSNPSQKQSYKSRKVE